MALKISKNNGVSRGEYHKCYPLVAIAKNTLMVMIKMTKIFSVFYGYGDGDGDKKFFTVTVTVTVTKKNFYGYGDGDKKIFLR